MPPSDPRSGIPYPASTRVSPTSRKATAIMIRHPLSVAESAFLSLHLPPFRVSKSSSPRYLTDDDRQKEDLLNWATSTSSSSSSSSSSSGIHIAPSTYGGSGLFASKPAKAGDILFVVPSKRCIALPSATSDEAFGEAFRHLADDGGPGGRRAALAGFVAKELLLNKFSEEPSKWGSYLDLLPWQTDAQSHFLYWSDIDIEDLLFESNSCDEVISFRTGVSQHVSMLLPCEAHCVINSITHTPHHISLHITD